MLKKDPNQNMKSARLLCDTHWLLLPVHGDGVGQGGVLLPGVVAG